MEIRTCVKESASPELNYKDTRLANLGTVSSSWFRLCFCHTREQTSLSGLHFRSVAMKPNAPLPPTVLEAVAAAEGVHHVVQHLDLYIVHVSKQPLQGARLLFHGPEALSDRGLYHCARVHSEPPRQVAVVVVGVVENVHQMIDRFVEVVLSLQNFDYQGIVIPNLVFRCLKFTFLVCEH